MFVRLVLTLNANVSLYFMWLETVEWVFKFENKAICHNALIPFYPLSTRNCAECGYSSSYNQFLYVLCLFVSMFFVCVLPPSYHRLATKIPTQLHQHQTQVEKFAHKICAKKISKPCKNEQNDQRLNTNEKTFKNCTAKTKS